MQTTFAMSTTFPPLSADEEKDLIQALDRGNREAADKLIRRTYRQVHRTLCRLCGNQDREAVEDLTQETYRRAWKALSSFEGHCRLSTWLFRITYTTYLNHVRRPRRLIRLPEGAEQQWPDLSPNAHTELEEFESCQRVRREVLALPETLRLTIIARFWADLPAREIARLEQISAVAVHKRLRKALKTLGSALEEGS